jgi:hypothetical protein
MNLFDYVVWIIGGGIGILVFGYLLTRVVSVAHYRSKSEYEFQNRCRGEKRDGKV